ncbi:hypothetical protein DVH05_012334 [Phytophthora capsici]|nr:hypothetical protein DVH05_012334 [Phytophthora capsici]
MKKDVLNGMLTTLQEEVAAYPSELDKELEDSGIRVLKDSPLEVKACGLANHNAAQRNKSIKAVVSTHYWVRLAHLKGMAIHERQPICVLDVKDDGKARMQVYSFKSRKGRAGGYVDSGVVRPLATVAAEVMMKDFIAAGILPMMLILRWHGQSNHFQAVNYAPERYERYRRLMDKLATQRNEILVKHGFDELDYMQRVSERLASAAAKVLRELRRASKLWQDSMAADGSEEEDGLAIDATTKSVVVKEGQVVDLKPTRKVHGDNGQTRSEEGLHEDEQDCNMQNTQKIRYRKFPIGKVGVLTEVRPAETAIETDSMTDNAGEAYREHEAQIEKPRVQTEPDMTVRKEQNIMVEVQDTGRKVIQVLENEFQ